MERKRTGWENAIFEDTTNFEGRPLAVLEAECGMPETKPAICQDSAGLRTAINKLAATGIISRGDAIRWKLEILLRTPKEASSQSGFCYLAASILKRNPCNATLFAGHVLKSPIPPASA